MSISKYYSKMKSRITPKEGEKLLIGKLANSANNPNLGYIDVYFEVVDGVVKTVESSELVDIEYTNKVQVFVRGGYENYEKEYGTKQLFLFRSYQNVQSKDKGECKYTCVYSSGGESQHFKINKDCPFIAEISNTEFSVDEVKELNSNHAIDRLDEDNFDTPLFFQIDLQSKKILGPLYREDKDKKYLHGPRNEIQYEFWNSRKISQYESLISNYQGYENHIKEIYINNVKRLFFINLDTYYIGKNKKPRNQDFQLVDLIPDSYLINEFYKSAEKIPSIRTFQKGKVKEWLDNKSLKIEAQRKKRLFKILTEYETSISEVSGIFKQILTSDLAEEKLKQFATEDEEKYLDRFRDKENKRIESIKEEIDRKRIEIEQQNEAIIKEINKSKKTLNELLTTKANLQEEIEKKLKIALENIEETPEYKKQLTESTKQLSEINKKIENAKEYYGHYDEVEKLNDKLQEIQSNVDFKIHREEELKSTIKELKRQASLESAELVKAYMNHQIISDIQNNEQYKYLESDVENKSDTNENIFLPVNSNKNFLTDDHNESRKLVVSEITKRLKSMKRNIDRDKVEAALIAIMQNQFVVFVGLPGSGKTSFAMQVGCALGADNMTLTVPVAKDWTRPKDLMGYYNPITNKYDSGVTDFYPFYQKISKLNANEATNSFLILDEFNLSQPEFYLSNLTGLADNSSNREVNLGHNKKITIPHTSRFICTANTDETVQSLSARMINRCAFIPFDDLPELKNTVDDLEFPDDLGVVLTGTDMVDLFTASESDILSDSLSDDINQLISAFRDTNEEYGNGISITLRKYKQLLQFCRVMSTQENTQSNVLDYAATFFLLPLVSGSGTHFKKRLENIYSISDSLSLEGFTNNMRKIIIDGEANFDHYRFSLG